MQDFIYNNKLTKRVLIVGYGVTGKSIENFLNKYNLDIDISESKEDFITRNLDSYDLLAVSPGISINKEPYDVLNSFSDKICSDIDLFFSAKRKTKTIAVTGSNGKSTIVSMLNHVLNGLGFKSICVGNIGLPILSEFTENYDYYIVELSSFQIDLLKTAHFDIGCVSNITQDHLDRYATYQDYIDSKLNLEKFCDKFFVYDFENNGKKYSSEYSIRANTIYKSGLSLLDLAQTKLSGLHNLENAIITALVLEALDISVEDTMLQLKSFIGLKHRCNVVKNVNSVKYINDSKGTNVGATIAALKSLTTKKNIVLLLGGVAKDSDFSFMKDSLEKYVKFVCIYGRDAQFIKEQIKDFCNYDVFDSLESAFSSAKTFANSGDIVLLSPACASFDEFKNFQDRGDSFIKLVESI